MTAGSPDPTSVDGVYAQIEESLAAMKRGEASPIAWAAAIFATLVGVWIVLRIIRLVLRVAGFIAAISAILGVLLYLREVMQGGDDYYDDDEDA